MSFTELVGLKKPKSPALEQFTRQFEVIKTTTEKMIATLNRFETRSTSPGHYWEKDSLPWNIGVDLFKKEPAWLYNNYRFCINEIFSGNPCGDYSQFQELNQTQLQGLPFVTDYHRFTQDIPEKYHIQEPTFPSAKQWGIKLGNKNLSADSTRFQRYITNLYKFGVFSHLEDQLAQGEQVYILEIGGGFGMLADYVMSSLSKNVKYILIDIPPTLASAAIYLSLTKPHLKQVMFDPESTEKFVLSEQLKQADIVFLPHYAANCLLDLPYINLAINTFSFQEMTEENIHYYADIISKKLHGYLYSDNFRRHPHNFALKSRICDILKQYFYLFPNNEDFYDKVERGFNYMWQAYTHLGTSKQRPEFLAPSVKFSDFIWGDNCQVDLKTGGSYIK